MRPYVTISPRRCSVMMPHVRVTTVVSLQHGRGHSQQAYERYNSAKTLFLKILCVGRASVFLKKNQLRLSVQKCIVIDRFCFNNLDAT